MKNRFPNKIKWLTGLCAALITLSVVVASCGNAATTVNYHNCNFNDTNYDIEHHDHNHHCTCYNHTQEQRRPLLQLRRQQPPLQLPHRLRSP